MQSLEDIVHELNATYAAVMIADVSLGYLYCDSGFNLPKEWVNIKNPLDESSLNGKAYVSRQAKIMNNMNSKLEGHFVSSVIIVPLMQNNQILGTVELISSATGKTFSEADLDRFKSFVQTFKVAKFNQ